MASSTAQVVTTVPVYDYILAAGDPTAVNPKGASGKKVKVTLAYDRQRSSAPSTWLLETPTYAAVTDGNGFWQVNLVPTDQMAIANSYYIVEVDGYASYKINPIAAGAPGVGWQSSAILLDAPATLTAAGQTVGPLQINGTLGVSGAVTLSSLTPGQVVFPGAAGLLSGDANLFWDNATKRLGVGTNAPGSAIQAVGIISATGANGGFRLGTTDALSGQIVLAGGNTFFDFLGILAIRTINGGLFNTLMTFPSGPGGQIQFQTSVALTGSPSLLSMQGAGTAVILGGTTGFELVNNANTSINLLLTDGGKLGLGRSGTVGWPNAALDLGAANVVALGASNPRFILYDDQTNASYQSYDGGALTHFVSTNAWEWDAVGSGVNRFGALTTIMSLGSNGQLFATGTIIAGGALQAAGDPGAGTASRLSLTSAVGIGNGANTNMQSPLKGTGSGPTTATLVTDWIKIYDGVTTRWIPAFT